MGENLFVLGGSSIYTILLLRDLAHSDAVGSLDAITLCGRDRLRLGFNARVGAHLMGQAGATTRVDAVTEPTACLDERYGILFNQVRVGGMAARDHDEKAALAAGLPADETLGVVGVSNAIRTIRELRPFFDVLSRKSAGFLIINFTNPCSIITQWLADSYGFAVVGICDYPEQYRSCLAAFLKIAPDAMDMRYFGLNHSAIVYDIRVNGGSILDDVVANSDDFSLRASFQRGFPYLFVPGWEYAFTPDSVYARQRSEPTNRAAALLAIERSVASLIADGCEHEDVFSELARRNANWYALAVVPLLRRCLGLSDAPAIVNGGAGDIFDLGRPVSVIEANAIVTRHGAQMAGPPPAVRQSAQFDLCRLAKRAELALLDGILAEDWDGVLAACALNPMIRSADRARRYFRALAQHDPSIANFGSTRSRQAQL